MEWGDGDVSFLCIWSLALPLLACGSLSPIPYFQSTWFTVSTKQGTMLGTLTVILVNM